MLHYSEDGFDFSEPMKGVLPALTSENSSSSPSNSMERLITCNKLPASSLVTTFTMIREIQRENAALCVHFTEYDIERRPQSYVQPVDAASRSAFKQVA